MSQTIDNFFTMSNVKKKIVIERVISIYVDERFKMYIFSTTLINTNEFT